jgi:UDP-2,4-diacetamido-2,4,6-trideoxy-beta-L-altropyranose hydrolase
MRCLALAQAWQDEGGTVAFACGDLPESLQQRLESEKCAVHRIDAHSGTESDIDQTRQLAESISPRWLVLDGYKFGPDFQLTLRDVKWRLMVLDDDGRHEAYHADVLLNQNAGAAAVLYGRQTHGTRMLLGCQYALLRREFLQTPRRTATSESVSRLLLSLGGADAKNTTARFLAVLWPCIPKDCEIHVLLGPANPHVTAMQEIAATMKRMVLHIAPPNVPEIMANCDLAITAAGSSVYELGYLGVPMLFVAVANNQLPIATALDQLGAGVWIDQALWSRDLPATLEWLIPDSAFRAQCAARFREMVDGQGAARVVTALSESGGVE